MVSSGIRPKPPPVPLGSLTILAVERWPCVGTPIAPRAGVSSKLATPENDFMPRMSIVFMATLARVALSVSALRKFEILVDSVPELELRSGRPPEISTSDLRPGNRSEEHTSELQ